VYAIEVVPESVSQIRSMHPKRFKQVQLRILTLQTDPRPPDGVLLDVETYLVRVGPYKITYKIDDLQQRVRVFLIEEETKEA
jgi:mRNA-degrading endonuclease RelE of RelBE toxin-antitoxin system